MNIFILPGNPPALHFYKLWADEIRERHPEARIEIALYPLLSNLSDSNEYFESLTQTVTDQILAFRHREGVDVSLVGHSLGGYLALKILEKIPNEIETCILLHPFLRQPRPVGRALLRIAHELRRLPALEKLLLQMRPVVSLFLSEAKDITAEEIHVFTELAYHEHLTIAQDTSPHAISPELLPKLRVYSTEGDIWCPPASVDSLGEEVQHTTGAASHNFVVKRHDRDLVYDFLVGALGR